jgi:ribosomal-protein-alanine acetyltransferase
MGPGPFTGLRSGIAFAQSFSLGRGIKWIGVCSLDAMAAGIKERDFLVSTDARRKERYWARYTDSVRAGQPQVSNINELLKLNLPIFSEGEYFPDPIQLAKLAKLNDSITKPIYIRKPDAYPVPKNIKFRAMTSLDLIPASAIEKQVYGKSAWSLNQFREEFSKVPKSAQYLVAELDGQVIGYAGIVFNADVADIHTITVIDSQRRKGIGRELLKRMIDWARSKKADAVMLEMRLGNDEARPLYEQIGFVEVSKRENYYAPGVTAVVMRKELK